jgi:hypothetical protein
LCLCGQFSPSRTGCRCCPLSPIITHSVESAARKNSTKARAGLARPSHLRAHVAGMTHEQLLITEVDEKFSAENAIRALLLRGLNRSPYKVSLEMKFTQEGGGRPKKMSSLRCVYSPICCERMLCVVIYVFWDSFTAVFYSHSCYRNFFYFCCVLVCLHHQQKLYCL